MNSNEEEKMEKTVTKKPVESKQEEQLRATKIDLKSRICLMAAFILGAGEPDMTVDQAIDKAVDIENAADAKVRELKKKLRAVQGIGG